jgi:hypothetical protein
MARSLPLPRPCGSYKTRQIITRNGEREERELTDEEEYAETLRERFEGALHD